MNHTIYNHTDFAPIGCDDCNGCSKCCTDMGESIVLDPYDMYMLTSNLKLAGGMPATYEILTSEDGPLTLASQNGLILPCIKMVVDEAAPADAVGTCAFLNKNGRCSIHKIRTGLCRLYPLGRTYHKDTLSYFVLDDALGCPSNLKTPVKIEDWIAIPDMDAYEAFLLKWHAIKKSLQSAICEGASSGQMTMQTVTSLMSRFLAVFYQKPYGKDFYAEFAARVSLWEKGI